ncbi:AAA family ATPase [Fredinandcohnia quinoae]|uniref:AAA family ATPase n=1 Tax=Fredinandcohnia quinoae TaxID=2918902 RepID=A0AAW5ECT1_9BACI|nr:AAA family ATPase [Fredinandcohnia sp. SECRCQ15]MCH1627712.1 AAA family ATPase [Fredinandcohnia sp. SECRCQ15]
MKSTYFRSIIVSIALTLFLTSILATPSKASSISPKDEFTMSDAYQLLEEYYEINEKEAKELHNEMVKAQKYYKYDSKGVIYFDEELALKNNVSKFVVGEITHTMDAIGKETLAELSLTAATCKGLSQFDSRNSRFFANDCQSDDLVIILAASATALGIVGLLATLWNVAVGVVYGAASLLFAFGATVVGVRNKGCGIYAYWSGPNYGIYSQSCW